MSFIGYPSGTVVFHGDIVSPVGEAWDAEAEAQAQAEGEPSTEAPSDDDS